MCILTFTPTILGTCLFQGEMEVTPACFPHLLHMVSSLAEGRVCVVLEVSINPDD